MAEHSCILEPHVAPPNMLDRHMTRYDYDYNREPPEFGKTAPAAGESGHSRNRPLFGRHDGKDWLSTYFAHYTDKRGIAIPKDIAAYALHAAAPRILHTAHIRGMRSMAGVPWPYDPEGISTYRDHYTPKWSTPSNGGAEYAGNRAAQFKPDFLAIDTPDGPPIGVSKWRGKGGVGEGRDPNDAFVAVPRKQDTLTVFGPPNGDGRPWTTEYGTYGNPALFKRQLLPTSLANATTGGDRSAGDKRGLIDTLAGRRQPPSKAYGSMFDTNPIPMNPLEQEKCRVARRHELEGPINMTIYQSDLVKQLILPELSDPVKARAVSAMPIMTKNLSLPPRPSHNTIKRIEARRLRSEIPDSHKHKFHLIPDPPKLVES